MDESLNPLQQIHKELTELFPTIKSSLDKPLVEDGVWVLDVFMPNKHIAVAWKSSKGFGLAYRNDHIYGEGADEVYYHTNAAFSRISELIDGVLNEQA